jgi:hypothetical protein
MKMKSNYNSGDRRLYTLIIIFGGIGVYLAEHKHPGANITNLGDAFWWAVVTMTTASRRPESFMCKISCK